MSAGHHLWALKLFVLKKTVVITDFVIFLQAEAAFLHHIYHHGGARRVCYTCIAAAGSSGATLHYGHAGAPNNRLVQDDAMLLFDFGAEYSGYCSDITCSFPASGKFTDKQKIVWQRPGRGSAGARCICWPTGLCCPNFWRLASSPEGNKV